MTRRELAPVRAVGVFDLVDGYAADRGVEGPRPRPLGGVRVEVVAGPQQVRRWPVPGELVLRTTSDGFRVNLGRVRVGRHVRRLWQSGVYAMTVTSSYYEPVELTAVSLPSPQPLRIRLRPGPRYPFPSTTVPAPTRTGGAAPVAPGPRTDAVVRGTLLDPQRRPVAGALVHFPGATQPAVTIATGDWLVLLPAGTQPPPPSTPIPVTLPDGGSTTTTYIPAA